MSFQTLQVESEDGVARAAERTLSQFQTSVVFHAVLQAFSQEVQELLDAITQVIVERGAADAFGVQLDALGRIVGQSRMLWAFGTLPWFAPDNQDARPDSSGLVWVPGVASGGTYMAPDNVYRQMIENKVYRNFCRYGSILEITDAIFNNYGIKVSFVLTAPMNVTMKVPTGTPAHVVNQMSQFYDSARMERMSPMPYPVTLDVSAIQYV